MEFEIARCKSKAAFAAKPKKQVSLDLAKVRSTFVVDLDTPDVVVVNVDDVEVIVQKNGELLFTSSVDETKMCEIAQKVYDISINS